MLQLEEYNLATIQSNEHFSEEILQSISRALNTLSDSTQYGGNMFVEDAIWEVAEDSMPIYRPTVFNNGYYLEDYVVQAIREGMIDLTNADSFSLYDSLWTAWTLLIRHYCHEEIHTVIYNYMADFLNSQHEDFNGCEEEIEDALDSVAQEHDSGDLYQDLDRIAESIYQEKIREEN